MVCLKRACANQDLGCDWGCHRWPRRDGGGRLCERAIFRKYYCFMGACFLRGNGGTYTPFDTSTHVTSTLPCRNSCHRNIWVRRKRFLNELERSVPFYLPWNIPDRAWIYSIVSRSPLCPSCPGRPDWFDGDDMRTNLGLAGRGRDTGYCHVNWRHNYFLSHFFRWHPEYRTELYLL